MAVDTPRISRMRLLAAKVESSTGTPETLLATDAAFVVIDPQFTPEVNMIEQQLPASMGQNTSIAGARKGTITFRLYMAGSGTSTTPAWATVFLPPCDWVETTGTFAAVHGGATLTMALFIDGVKHTLVGARGTFKISMKAGEPASIEFTFTGKLADDVDAAILSPTFPAVMAPTWTGGLTLGSYTPRLSELSVDAGNAVTMREDAGDATGYFAAAITSRKPAGNIDPEMSLMATRNWMANLKAGTEEAMSLVIGSATHNTITIAAARAQTIKVANGNRNDLATVQANLQFNGDSPFTIAFS